ncbi:MAG: hypothetical protein AAF587_00490 [Bacteroidota bacterium]
MLSGLSSQLPWGIGDVTPTELPHHQLDELVQQKDLSMNLILTAHSMSFVSTRTIEYYSLVRFFSMNALLGLVSGLFLCLLLHVIRERSRLEKLKIVMLFGLFCVFSIHLSYWNWWGFSTSYSIGVSLATLFNLFVVTFFLSTFIFKPSLTAAYT